MEGAGAYPAALEAALASSRGRLEGAVLPGFVESLRLFSPTYNGMCNVLLKKGLIREDPYRNEEPISEPAVPSTEWFAPSELPEQMGIRLTQLHQQLDYVLANTKFGVEELTPRRLKLIVGLVRYVDFANLSETSASVTTSSFAALIAKVTHGADAVAASIAKDGVSHLADYARRILKAAAELQLFQRESYKLELRRKAIPASSLDASSAASDSGAALAAIHAATRSAGLPFNQELASELLAEDYPADPATGAELRSRVLARLHAGAKPEGKHPAGPSRRESLLEAIGGLGSTETALHSALRCIRDNEALVRGTRLTTLGRVRRFILRVAGKRQKPKGFEIELLDEAGGSAKVERIVYSTFWNESVAKAQGLRELASRSGAAYQLLQEAAEDKVYDHLTALVGELQVLVRRLDGLNTLFRSMVAPRRRGLMRGIHGDLSLIRAAIAKANRQRHEYIASREEEEQLRTLGIAPPT